MSKIKEVSQSIRDLKQQTPCGTFKKGDILEYFGKQNIKHLMWSNYDLTRPNYTFDSFDSYDGTVFIYGNNEHFTTNVQLKDIKSYE